MMDRCDIERVSRLKVESQMCDRNIVFLMGQISEKEGFAATLTHEVFHRFYQERIGKIWDEVSANEVKIRWNEQQIESIEDKWRREKAEQLAALVSKESVDLGYEHCTSSLVSTCKAPITACRLSSSQQPAPSQRGSYVLEPEAVPSRQTMVRSSSGQGTMFDGDDGDSDEPPVPAPTHAVAPAVTEPVTEESAAPAESVAAAQPLPPAESVSSASADAAQPEDLGEAAADDDGQDEANETVASTAAPAAAQAATAPRQVRHHHPYKQKKKKHKQKRRR